MKREYEYQKTSLQLEGLIKGQHKLRERDEELYSVAGRLWDLPHKLAFRSDMIMLLLSLRRAKRTEAISKKDAKKLMKIWKKVWRRKRCR